MKLVKRLAIVLAIYVGLVVAFESLVGVRDATLLRK
jgi:hypothetical protein